MVQYFVHQFFYRIFGGKGITFQRFFFGFSQAIFLATEQGPKPWLFAVGEKQTTQFFRYLLYKFAMK